MISVDLSENSQIAEARRVSGSFAKQQGFNEADSGRVALIATELASNVLKHAGRGEMLVGSYVEGAATGIEMVALDQGRGISNVKECLADGFSTAGTAGHGLGAVVRQSSFVDIASSVGVGTAVLARVAAGPTKRPTLSTRAAFGAISVPKSGEDVCGDSWAIDENGPTVTLFVADGLGHGPDAAEASVEAVRLFRRFHGHQVPTLIDYVHGGLRATRGAAVSIARYQPEARLIVFAGIGNVAGALASGNNLRRMVSMPGTAGYNVRKIQSFQYPFAGGLVILCSDGIGTSWTLARYPNLSDVHPTLIAAVLYRDFGRRHDDVTVLVGKWPYDA